MCNQYLLIGVNMFWLKRRFSEYTYKYYLSHEVQKMCYRCRLLILQRHLYSFRRNVHFLRRSIEKRCQYLIKCSNRKSWKTTILDEQTIIKITLYHKNGRKIPGTESKITGKLVGRTTKRWRFYWWRHLLKLNKFHIDGQRFLQTVFYWQLHCCDFLFGGVNKAIYCWT